MIVVDTSALMAILLNERDADSCAAALQSEAEILISAGTAAEAYIVAGRRGLGDEMERLVEALGFQIIDVTSTMSVRIAKAYAKWGKGAHPAALIFGDCFAYALAQQRNCPLLFVGSTSRKPTWSLC